MILPHFDYVTPESLDQVSAILKEKGSAARVMAGATDLIIPMKDGAVQPVPETIIDLKRLDGMRELEYDEEQGLKIGALTTLRQIEFSDLVWDKNPAVATAAKSIASTQIRAKGTMAGNICNASPSCDSGPIIVASDAAISIHGPEGDRVVKGAEFFTGFKKTALEQGEFVTAITFPPLKANQKAAYIKHAVRKAMDLAIVGVAAIITVEDGICTDARIALGAVAITPIRAPKAEEILIGKELTDDVIEAAAQAAMESCAPITDIRASKEYRAAMVKVFTKRAIGKCLEQM
ncbi:MAG: xanthine dehydrogenase family protein subunit M [Mogibacterium sp.]|nr:xanthine dehydrogenase family protein subunit M [Mogibacterium sp.]